MPVFTIETTYRLPLFRHRTYAADTVEQACRLAVEDDDWDDQRRDYEATGDAYVSGAWRGETAYSGRAEAVPSRFEETGQRKVDLFETLLGLLKIFAHERPLDEVDRKFWAPRARDAIAKAEAILIGANNPDEESSEASISYVVARIINHHGEMDYLCGWDVKWGTCASSLQQAMRFPTLADAEAACARARALVPTFIGGQPIEYRAVPIAP
ncbi:hypothetical protein [Methylocapsa sp. S129]|uniref:hypothetical protein n=1 Tax=Methylocapsa sp. S129 TaxID=1641869 RepID=UPI00352B32E9